MGLKSKSIAVVFLILACIVALFVSCDSNKNSEPKVEPKAEVKFVANMMGSASAETTTEGNFASKDAMSEGAYIDAEGAIHGTFTQIDDSKFTAFWGAGKTTKSYYARYDLLIDALTAEAEGSSGTFLFYIKTSYNGETKTVEYGTSKSRAKCTVLGQDGDDAKKLEIKYYVLDGVYNKVTNTAVSSYSEIPETYRKLLTGKTPVYTFTIADDAVFKTE